MSKNSKVSKFKSIVGIGSLDYELSLTLTEKECNSNNFVLSQINSIKDCKGILSKSKILSKINIASRNNLINLLLFINKSNPDKSFVEFLSINSLFISDEIKFVKNKIKENFDENFLFLIESNIINPSKFKLIINTEKGESKELEFDINEANKIAEMKEKKDTEENESKPQSGQSINEKKLILPSVVREYNDPEITPVEGRKYSNKRPNLLNKIVYDFDHCNYVFLDLNNYLFLEEISLIELLIYLKLKIENLQVKLITIFPLLEESNSDNYDIETLLELINLSDFTLFNKRDSIRFTKLLGYSPDEKSFEARFISLKEFKKGSKPTTSFLIVDDFNFLNFISIDNKTNFINQHRVFNFEMGFRLEYLKALSTSFELLMYVFYGGFFSRIIGEKSLDEAFHAGKIVMKKTMDLLIKGKNYIFENEDYFVVNDNELPDFKKIQKNNFSNVKSNNVKLSSSLKMKGETKRNKILEILKLSDNVEERLNKLMSLENDLGKASFNSKSISIKKLPGIEGFEGNLSKIYK